MARSLTKDEIFALPLAERLCLIETLWDSLNPDQLPLPESHEHAIDEALAEYRQDPQEGRSWDEVRDEQ
jgi:putative addiction module component, TIGR02574 family